MKESASTIMANVNLQTAKQRRLELAIERQKEKELIPTKPVRIDERTIIFSRNINQSDDEIREHYRKLHGQSNRGIIDRAIARGKGYREPKENSSQPPAIGAKHNSKGSCRDVPDLEAGSPDMGLEDCRTSYYGNYGEDWP